MVREGERQGERDRYRGRERGHGEIEKREGWKGREETD